jgi:hypothetical protein
MSKPKSRKKKAPKRVLALPDLEHAKMAVLNSLTSPRGQRTYDHAIREFVTWYCSKRPEGSKAFVLPITGGALVPIADGPSWEWQDMVQWSPDGRMIYFVSDRNGFFNVWGRRFDPRVGPVGPLLQVTALDNPARTISPLGGGAQLAMAISRDRLVVPLFETSGPSSIWMIDNIDR